MLLGLMILGTTFAVSEDWRVAAGAFLGSVSAHLVTTANLQRLVRRALAKHREDCAAYHTSRESDSN